MNVHSELNYGRDAANRIAQAAEAGIEGARALLESFYYAFNNRDMAVFEKVWAEEACIQLNNPLGGIMRGYDAIAALYRKIFNGPAKVWVAFSDIVEFQSADMVVFAGREAGEFAVGETSIKLAIRTSRVVQRGPAGWRQVHHHGSIDDAGLLADYQRAVAGDVIEKRA
jgi:hypothetical protein